MQGSLCGFESRLPRHFDDANVVQLVELHLPKVAVVSSSLIIRSKSGSISVGREPSFQVGCRGFEPRLSLQTLCGIGCSYKKSIGNNIHLAASQFQGQWKFL